MRRTFFLFLLGFSLTAGPFSCTSESSTPEKKEPEVAAEEPMAEKTSPESDRISLPSGVQYKDLKVGDGAVVKAGQTINCHATGKFTDERCRSDSALFAASL